MMRRVAKDMKARAPETSNAEIVSRLLRSHGAKGGLHEILCINFPVRLREDDSLLRASEAFAKSLIYTTQEICKEVFQDKPINGPTLDNVADTVRKLISKKRQALRLTFDSLSRGERQSIAYV
jgi:hypothetical protein